MLETGQTRAFTGSEPLQQHLRGQARDFLRHEPLHDSGYRICTEPASVEGAVPVAAYLGVDVGSISTNLVVIDSSKRVIARRYLMTAGRPIEAVRQGLLEIGNEIGGQVAIRGVATTGSGRYLIGDFIGADVVKNEITAHARGALSIDPRVDTIFEIGGQDSKYIRLENGAVVDFTMNKACAAGTGSFLEEQAEKLAVSIKDEFGGLALSSDAPAALGERCTVFMESSLNRLQQLGAAKQDLVAGLSYSIVLNYLNRVVEDRRVGEVIFFQGGTAYNRGVTAAFEKVCGKKITVPPHHDVLGAVGCALIALEHCPAGPSRFKGFDLAQRQYALDSFACADCPNACEIRRVSIAGEPPLHYGSRCGKFDEQQRPSLGKDLPRLFSEREKILLEGYAPAQPLPEHAPTIGFPRATIFYEMFPFWNAFFAELGFRLVPSAPTNRALITTGCETALEETCFPIKVAHGHILELLARGVDYLFLPCVVNLDHVSSDAETSYNCLYVQSLPYVARAAIDFSKYSTRVLVPVFHFEWGEKVFVPEMQELARELGCSGKKVQRAIAAAWSSLHRFRKKLVQRGQEILGSLPQGTPALVLVSRPYNGGDPGLNCRIPDLLRDLGALAIPLDFLPVPQDPDPDMKRMYWRYGQRILAGARTIARDPRLHAVYVTNFGCGPDSFITKYFSRELHGKPFLTLELDEHSADAGVITRLEAFLDSLAVAGAAAQKGPSFIVHAPAVSAASNHRTVYIPYMDDHGLALAAAMRFCGIDAEALPMADDETISLGSRYTTGKECYPCILTTGDIVKKALADKFDPSRASFFMPTAMGPCRFGQYSRFHRLVLDELGLHEVPILVLDQTEQYQGDLRRLGSKFRRLGWQSMIITDYMKKLLLQTRPYELHTGETDRIYLECLDRLVRTIEQQGALGDCAAYALERFASVAVDRSAPRPLIGVVGEIYVRSNQFSNNFIIRRIEALGGEAVMPPMQEWVAYTDWERRKDLLRNSGFAGGLQEWATHKVQNYYAAKIRKGFSGRINHFFSELPTGDVMRLSAPYVSEHVRGEANLSMGRAVEYARHPCNGIVNLIPFGCMPGTIVNALLSRFSGHYPDIPVLKMVYDGTRQSGDQTRIEAFMYQARESLLGKTPGTAG
jgi:predicted CoA-substrate-specific enzyme activase